MVPIHGWFHFFLIVNEYIGGIYIVGPMDIGQGIQSLKVFFFTTYIAAVVFVEKGTELVFFPNTLETWPLFRRRFLGFVEWLSKNKPRRDQQEHHLSIMKSYHQHPFWKTCINHLSIITIIYNFIPKQSP